MSKEILLGALVASELQQMKGKFEFYNVSVPIPQGDSWTSRDSITLEQFLDKSPTPTDPKETALYGVAWEFIWGKKPPQEIIEAKSNLLLRSRTGMEITDIEKLWLKLMAVDTDMF